MSKDISKRLEEVLDQVVLDNALIAKRSSLDKYNNPQEIEKELNSIKQRALEAIKQEIKMAQLEARIEELEKLEAQLKDK